ncbi:E3 ubiquitin-protein ligase PRT1-like isoform X2 [Tasmannia lanceolata]
MSGSRESHCPLCRHPFLHFPYICHVLHFLLLKMFPVAYKRREREVLEEEKKIGHFSPQFEDFLKTERLHTEKINTCTVVESFDCDSSPNVVMMVPEESCVGKSEDNRNTALDGKKLPENGIENEYCKHISVTDVMCAACKHLLFQPVVLNCGHVYCKTCITASVDDILTCQDCLSLHPGGLPKVCLELDNFLEKQFPNEYALRKEVLQFKHVHHPQEGLTECSRQNESEKQGTKSLRRPIGFDVSTWNELASEANAGVGCDGCGMYPIIGKWYRCKDCVEAIGFDLCERCYNTRSKLPGRFNQKHRPDHNFILVQRNVIFSNIMLLARGRSV